MAITYPIDFPANLGYTAFSIDLVPVVSASESPFTNEVQVQEHQGIAWVITATVAQLERADAEVYNTWLLKLKGKVGTFTTIIPGSETPRGIATGTPLVDGAGQTGRTLDIKGMTINITGIFLAGDFIQIGTGSSTKLYKILSDANTDGAGLVSVDVAPEIVTSPADNDPVVVSNCKGLFRLMRNENPLTIAYPNIHGFSFAAKEVL